MSLLRSQNIVGGVATMGAAYSFKTTTRGPDDQYEYTSPSRSYAPDAIAQAAWSQGDINKKGPDGVDVLKSTQTVYGPDESANGVVSRMSNSDSSLLTGIARVIAGDADTFSTDYFAKTYFKDRSARSLRSYRNTASPPDSNAGGSGAIRGFFTSSFQYPDQILSNSNGSEFTPVVPPAARSNMGLQNLIPVVVAAPDEGGDPDNNDEIAKTVDGENNTTAEDAGHGPAPEEDSVELTEIDPTDGHLELPPQDGEMTGGNGNGGGNNSSSGTEYGAEWDTWDLSAAWGYSGGRA